VDLGFRTDHLLTFGIPMPQDRLKTPEQVTSFYRELLGRLAVLPGVSSASASTGMPVNGTSFGMPFSIAGKPVADPSQRPGAGYSQVTPAYFKTFGIEMLKGRAFTAQDTAGSVRVAVVNDTFVKRYLKGVDPIGQRLVIEQLSPGVTKLGPAVEWEIVGVSRYARNAGPRGGDFPEIDVPFEQSPWPSAGIALRTSGDPATMQRSAAAVVQSLDPDLPIANVKTMDQLVYESMAGDRFNTLLFASFAGLALLLAAVGIYGVMSFVVAQRTHEIGLKMALGAGRGLVVRQVLGEGLTTASIGVGLGLVGAWFVGRAMQTLWFGVTAFDPPALAAVSITLLAAAFVACLVPARRASLVDPMVALRDE
jgi:putative ABC transport system permease protein